MVGVARQAVQLAPGPHIPVPDREVVARGEEREPVGREGHGPQAMGVTQEQSSLIDEWLFAGLPAHWQLPDPNGRVGTESAEATVRG